MRQIVETEDVNFRIWALDAKGTWIHLLTVRATDEQFDFYRMPWILSIEDLKQEESEIGTPQNSI